MNNDTEKLAFIVNKAVNTIVESIVPDINKAVVILEKSLEEWSKNWLENNKSIIDRFLEKKEGIK